VFVFQQQQAMMWVACVFRGAVQKHISVKVTVQWGGKTGHNTSSYFFVRASVCFALQRGDDLTCNNRSQWRRWGCRSTQTL